mgnify:CR=1 FL=1
MSITRRPVKPLISRTSRFWDKVIARSRPEGLRWLRSDGTPNWSQRVSRSRVGGVDAIASKPPIVVHKSSTVMEAVDLIGSHRIRGLPVVEFNKLVGVITAMDIVNYLGGGEYYNIVVKRYEGNVFRALREERVSSIANLSPTAVYASDDVGKVLELMIGRGLGFLPVINEEGFVEGVITEHDMVKLLVERKVGVKASEVMTKTIVSVNVDDSLKKVAETMVRHGFRRLVVLSGDSIEGSVSAKGYVSLYSSRRAFTFLKSTSIDDILSLPASEILERDYLVVQEDVDVGEVAELMMKTGLNWVLVARGNEVTGIVTERDVLTALALEVA